MKIIDQYPCGPVITAKPLQPIDPVNIAYVRFFYIKWHATMLTLFCYEKKKHKKHQSKKIAFNTVSANATKMYTQAKFYLW